MRLTWDPPEGSGGGGGGIFWLGRPSWRNSNQPFRSRGANRQRTQSLGLLVESLGGQPCTGAYKFPELPGLGPGPPGRAIQIEKADLPEDRSGRDDPDPGLRGA